MINVELVTENPDGSADVKLNVDADGMKILLQYGFIALMQIAIEQAKNEKISK